MPYATTGDHVRLYYEEVGQGVPVLFVHEFACDHRGWEPQLREFGKRYRCIAYAARGYTPSDVPASPDAYSYLHVMRDAVAVLDHLKIDARASRRPVDGRLYRAAGCAQSSATRALLGARRHRLGQRALVHRRIPQESRATLATVFEREGSAAVAATYGNGPARVPFADQGCARLCRIHQASRRARRARLGAYLARLSRARGPRSTISRTRSAS